ncbi:MAG: TIGR01777 family protein [Chlamydiales bacterium 38-26]|nr:TIGR01777 family oxidoreductase [Chlamydiales bacterium]OJV07674.1 MAG: TIGR01777 family protein [Chlamydiales bacterium 38-26]
MKVVIAGATGLVGSELTNQLIQEGHQVKKLVRREARTPNEIAWNPEQQRLSVADLEGTDVVINLAGENISEGRWTAAKKKSIIESRLLSTSTLTNAVLTMQHPPSTFINASAVGFYGNRSDELLTEKSANGEGFLAHVCKEWEKAAEPLTHKKVRLVYSRFGVILSPHGGALKKMLTPFKLGLGGVIGSGKQFMSWIALEDVVGSLIHLMLDKSIHGPVNIVSSQPVTNAEFTKTLGTVLSRPTIFSVPTSVARFVFGEMADELLLSSLRVSNQKLLESGYSFKQPNLEQYLRNALNT